MPYLKVSLSCPVTVDDEKKLHKDILEITHRTLTESVASYLTAFMNANVPGLRHQTAVIDTDARSGDVRLLSCRLLDESGQTICLVHIQVEPEVRVVYCQPVFEEEANG